MAKIYTLDKMKAGVATARCRRKLGFPNGMLGLKNKT